MNDNDPSGLQVGELAQCAGLTVRILHYYDEIGLLRPSTRLRSGYRSYGENDIARLYHIQALRHFGLALPEIVAILDKDRELAMRVLASHIQVLGERTQRADQLRSHLIGMYGQLESGESPTAGEWKAALHLFDATESVPAMQSNTFRRHP